MAACQLLSASSSVHGRHSLSLIPLLLQNMEMVQSEMIYHETKFKAEPDISFIDALSLKHSSQYLTKPAALSLSSSQKWDNSSLGSGIDSGQIRMLGMVVGMIGHLPSDTISAQQNTPV